MLVQLFREVRYLPHDWVAGPVRSTDAIFTRPSAVWYIASGMSPMEGLGQYQDARRGASNPGLAWAGRRELLDGHGFYDALIIGGGDRAMACACYGCFDAVIDLQRMNEPQKQRYLAWARPFHETVRGAATFLDCSRSTSGMVICATAGRRGDPRISAASTSILLKTSLSATMAVGVGTRTSLVCTRSCANTSHRARKMDSSRTAPADEIANCC